MKKALILTIGTGDKSNLEGTLIKPLKKSISKGEWTKIILLPSQKTIESAELIKKEISESQIEIKPLDRDEEENVDHCYDHFQKVISALIDEGFNKNNILSDFTRGTKAMSAALVLASVRHDIPTLRYITGNTRDERGIVVPGCELVNDFNTSNATAHKLLDEVYKFFEVGNFSAALNLIPDTNTRFKTLYPSEVMEIAGYARPLAEFYSKWDRLDYKGAKNEIENLKQPPDKKWNRFNVTPEIKKWVERLAGELPLEPTAMAERLRLLAADLLANGERRIRDRQFEDAVIRAYRVIELIGQFRLFDRGLDSGKLDPENEFVKKFALKAEKEKSP